MRGVFRAPKPWGHVVLSVAPPFQAIFTPKPDPDQANFEGWEADPRVILINEVGVRYDPFDPGAAKILALHGLRGTVTFEPTGGLLETPGSPEGSPVSACLTAP